MTDYSMPVLSEQERETLIAEIKYNRENCFLSKRTEVLMQIALAALTAEQRKLFTCTGCGFCSIDEPAESDCHCFIDGRRWVESVAYTQPAIKKEEPRD